jgi:hypothetical protein
MDGNGLILGQLVEQLWILARIFLLAALVEGMVEYLISWWLKQTGKEYPPEEERNRTMAIRYAAAAIGIFLCIAYGVDLLALLGLEAKAPFVILGPVLTGILVGRGSNYVHDFVGQWVRPVLDGGPK